MKFAEAKKVEEAQAKKNQELLQSPRYWTKILGFMILFGAFIKYEVGVREHHPHDTAKV